MSDTPLIPLDSGLYEIPKGIAIFFPRENGAVSEKGYRLGDMDSMEIEFDIEETERQSNETPVAQTVVQYVQSVTTRVRFELMQLSDRNRAASMMGDVGAISRNSETKIVELADPKKGGIYNLGEILLKSVSIDTMTDGTDYVVDKYAGLVEFLKDPGAGPIDVEIETAELSDHFETTIASNTDLRGKLVYRGTNELGPLKMVTLNDVQIRPNGARRLIGTEFTSIQMQGIAAPDPSKPNKYRIGFETTLLREIPGQGSIA